jgi:ATP adenylyltransferase
MSIVQVKYQEQWDVLCEQPEMLDRILAAIGIPREKSSFKSHV